MECYVKMKFEVMGHVMKEIPLPAKEGVEEKKFSGKGKKKK